MNKRMLQQPATPMGLQHVRACQGAGSVPFCCQDAHCTGLCLKCCGLCFLVAFLFYFIASPENCILVGAESFFKYSFFIPGTILSMLTLITLTLPVFLHFYLTFTSTFYCLEADPHYDIVNAVHYF